METSELQRKAALVAEVELEIEEERGGGGGGC